MAPNRSRPCGLPSKFEFVGELGRGAFGKVVKCIDTETLRIVAIKMPTRWTSYTKNELPILTKSMSHNLDKCNIVKYIECFQTIRGKALVFETLDMSLYDYRKLNNNAPMLLSDIRTIIQQLATAFDALKGIGVIHTDLKQDNIMMVNHFRRPFKVKLIDFGVAIPTLQAKNIMPRVPAFSSPEVFLGGEFNEATDMWSLGCCMFQMIYGCNLFVGHSSYETMVEIVEFFGKPADHLLKKGDRTKNYFTKTDDGVWRIKTPLEYFKHQIRRTKNRHGLKSLDELKRVRLEKDNKTEAVERQHCIELLKAMLAVNADERITPHEILTHPFITKVYPNVQTLSKDFKCKPPAAALDHEDSSNVQPGDCPPIPEIRSEGAILVRSHSSAKNTTLLEDQESTVSKPAPLRDDESSNIQPGDCTPSPDILPSGAILVRPVTAENTPLMEDQESTVSEPTAAPLRDEESSNIQQGDCTPSPDILPSGAILVRPATAENTLLMEDQESTVSEPTAAPLRDEESSSIQPDDCTPSPDILPSGAILVRPATAENTPLLEDQESTVSEPTAAPLRDDESSNIQPGDCTPSPDILPSGAILVRPATAENTPLMEDQESTVSEPTAAPLRGEESSNIQPGDCTPSPDILPSGAILVRPATAENTTLLEDQESTVSEPTAAPLRDDESSNIQPGDCTPSPDILPSGAILVRPATAENTPLMEDQESTVSEPTAAPLRGEESCSIQPDDCTPSPDILPSGAILVRPATAENTPLMEDQESTVSEPIAAPLRDEESSNIQPGDCTPSPDILPSGAIVVRPHSSAENSTLLEDQEIPVSFQAGQNKTSQSSVNNIDSNRKTSEDSTTCEDTGPKKKGKKKKNCFRRIVSWLRKTFSCCVSGVDDD